MSGGSYNYQFNNLIKLVDDLREENDEHTETRILLARALKEIADQCKKVEWIDSCDYSKETFKEVKEWLNQHNFF